MRSFTRWPDGLRQADLSLSFLICRMGLMTFPVLWGEMFCLTVCHSLRGVPGCASSPRGVALGGRKHGGLLTSASGAAGWKCVAGRGCARAPGSGTVC